MYRSIIFPMGGFDHKPVGLEYYHMYVNDCHPLVAQAVKGFFLRYLTITNCINSGLDDLGA